MTKPETNTETSNDGTAKPAGRTVRLKVRRQDGHELTDTRRWETFDVPFLPRMNVVGALREIQKNPVTTDGREVAPVAWESSCLEEVCGSCTMVINGRVRQSCSALIADLSPKKETIVLEPMSKFPLVRDLIVDRSRMFSDLKRVRAWVTLDGTEPRGPAPRQSQEQQQELYPLSRCMTCGCCLEACPQYGEQSEFIGAAPLNQVRLFNAHPTGRFEMTQRLEAVMGNGGVEDCGKAQNCVEVCPMEIPLVDSIQKVARQTTTHLIKRWLLG
jgi:succinate dehydrogenase / fumarate reductase iron-sulfur subunit